MSARSDNASASSNEKVIRTAFSSSLTGKAEGIVGFTTPDPSNAGPGLSGPATSPTPTPGAWRDVAAPVSIEAGFITPMKSNTKANKSPREPDLADAVARCGADASMMDRLGQIYENADRATARTGAVCLGGGPCCRFDLFAHRLYLTPAELALLVSQPAPDSTYADPGRCPYQSGPRCVAYARRPLGCRIFFCRGEKQQFERLYERYHREIRSLHESCCIPYSYGELTACFMQLFPNE